MFILDGVKRIVQMPEAVRKHPPSRNDLATLHGPSCNTPEQAESSRGHDGSPDKQFPHCALTCWLVFAAWFAVLTCCLGRCRQHRHACCCTAAAARATHFACVPAHQDNQHT